MRRSLRFVGLLAVMFTLTALPAFAAKADDNTKDKEAIAKNAEAFIEAFHRGDATAVAAFWTPDGEYTDKLGRRMKGRDAIEKAFKGFLAANKGLKLRIDSDSLRFVTPHVALEEGTTAVITPDGGPPSRAHYNIVHVKKDGHWYLDSVRDTPYIAPSNYAHLRGLEFAIGDWAGEGDKGQVERLSVSWSENQNFIHASFSSTVKDIPVGSAEQWIGWNPIGKNIRSWIFDATGGFGEGSWKRDGKKWTIKTSTVLQDGKKATATYVLTSIDVDTITLQSRDRTENGEKLPDAGEIKLKRIK